MSPENNLPIDWSRINTIKVEDIPTDMPGHQYIGRTIEKVTYDNTDLYIKFTDGTFGWIVSQFPIHIYGRKVFKEHVSKGEAKLYCKHHSAEEGCSLFT